MLSYRMLDHTISKKNVLHQKLPQKMDGLNLFLKGVPKPMNQVGKKLFGRT